MTHAIDTLDTIDATGPSDATEAAVTRLVHAYEQLAPGDVSSLVKLYAVGALFKDPFNEVQGQSAIERVFAHMFRTLDRPCFVVSNRIVQGRQAMLTWEFHFNFKGQSDLQTVRGATHLQFDAHGLVTLHRDYWDAAEELYERLPVLGRLMRYLRRRLRAT